MAIGPNRTITLQPQLTIAGTQTAISDEKLLPPGILTLAIQGSLVRAGGGTSVKVYVQTSLDGGASWCDVACQTFATTTAKKVSALRTSIALAASYTPTDGSLADDSIKDGLLGDRIRCKSVITGTYTGASSITVTAVAN